MPNLGARSCSEQQQQQQQQQQYIEKDKIKQFPTIKPLKHLLFRLGVTAESLTLQSANHQHNQQQSSTTINNNQQQSTINNQQQQYKINVSPTPPILNIAASRRERFKSFQNAEADFGDS